MRYGKHTKCLFQLGMEKGPVLCMDWFLYFEIFEKKCFFLKIQFFWKFLIFWDFRKNDDDCDDDDVDDYNYNSL